MNKEDFVRAVNKLNDSGLVPAIKVDKFGVQEVFNIGPQAIRRLRIINDVVQFAYSQQGKPALANINLESIKEVFDYTSYQ